MADWREMAADQNARMAAKMLEQQGMINDLKVKAVQLARGLLEIAGLAFPDTYLATESRCQLARQVLLDLLPDVPDSVMEESLQIHRDIMGTDGEADGVSDAVRHAYRAGWTRASMERANGTR